MNIERIKAQVAKAIEKMPTTIELMRYTKTSDGMGGFILSDLPVKVATFNGVLDNSGHGFISPQVAEAGTVTRQRTPKLIVVYGDDFIMLRNDEFIVAGTTYKVNNPANILNLNIYWECDLEVVT